jgi:GNAT superfamily N-acetyltransferase
VPFVVEPLSNRHDRTGFDCGVEDLNRFLRQYGLQNQKKHFVRTYVCCTAIEIVGYYSLAFGAVNQEKAPESVTRGMGKYQVPAIILGRLAIDKKYQRKGFGAALLKDAILRAKQAEQIGGLRVIVVHAKDANAQAFYLQYGFIPSKGDPLTLFFPIEFDVLS